MKSKNAKKGTPPSSRKAGSKEENLEQYGVWVKVEPEEVDQPEEDEAQEPMSDSGDEDLFDLPDFDSTDEAEISTEEENLLKDLEEDSSPDSDDFSLPDEETDAGESEELPEFDLEDLEDIELPDEQLSLEEEISAADFGSEEPESEEPSDLTFDDLDETETKPGTEAATEDLDLEESEAFDLEPEFDIEAEDLDLEDETSSEPESEGLPSFDLPESETPMDMPELGDLGLDEEPLDEDLPELEVEEPPAEDQETEAASDIDDLSELEKELVGPQVVEAPQEQISDVSRALETITEELRAIKAVISDLKSELVVIKQESENEVEIGLPAEEEEGFFDEEEDETIALTGSELDNILQTAEITEEEAEQSAAAIEEPESLTEKDDILSFGVLDGQDAEEPDETAEEAEDLSPEILSQGLADIDLSDEADEGPAVEIEGDTPDLEIETAGEVPPQGEPAKDDLRSVLEYLDKLLGGLPDEKIREFSRSQQFQTYKKLFRELGLKR